MPFAIRKLELGEGWETAEEEWDASRWADFAVGYRDASACKEYRLWKPLLFFFGLG